MERRFDPPPPPTQLPSVRLSTVCRNNNYGARRAVYYDISSTSERPNGQVVTRRLPMTLAVGKLVGLISRRNGTRRNHLGATTI